MLKKLIRLFKPPRLSQLQRPRKVVLRKEGVHYNLDEIYTKVNQTYFEGKLNLHITWFNPKKTRYQRRIVLGSYHRDKNLVKINRILDQADIPEYYISFIVYHEMLHHVAPRSLRDFGKDRSIIKSSKTWKKNSTTMLLSKSSVKSPKCAGL